MSFIYMNNAATSWPKPPCVAEAVAQALNARPGAMHRGGIDDSDVFEAVRTALFPLVGADSPSNIALGFNATWALNLAIGGMDLSAGDTVVTTSAEHNSVLRPLYALEKQGVKVIYLETDLSGRVPGDVWESAMRKHRPKLAVFSHASNVTGAVNDAAFMTSAAKSAGAAVLIDASQTLGWIKLNAAGIGADMAAFTGHKYLLGPQGTGGLWVRSGFKLRPLLVGGVGIMSDVKTMPEEMPLHLEAGTGNEPSFHGLYAALKWAEENPRDTASCSARLSRLKEGLLSAGAKVVLPEGECTPVVSFNLPGYSASDVGYILTESYDIVCRTGLHCAPMIFKGLQTPQTVRLSLSRFTTDAETDAVVSAVKEILS